MDLKNDKLVSWGATGYHIALLLLAASIPLSKYTTSLFQFVVLGFWLLYNSDTRYIEEFREGKQLLPLRIVKLSGGFFLSIFHSLISKFLLFFRNKAAMVVTSLLLLHVIGLFYSSDLHYAIKDLRTKLPLLLLPLFFSTGPRVNTRTLYWLLIGYIAAIFGGTIYRLILYLSLPVADPRAFDAHTSHIRFSLNAVFAIFILFYFIRLRDYFTLWQKALFAVLIVWLIFFMTYLRYSTGLSLLIIVSLIVILYMALNGARIKKRLILLAAGLVLILLPIVYIISVAEQYRSVQPVYFPQLETNTRQGNYYVHDTVNFRVENGKFVGLYICEKELRKSWAGISKFPIDSLDGKQQKLRYTLIRYLASRDLRKDSAGVALLTAEDVRNIESGMAKPSEGNGFDIRSQINDFLVGWDNYQRNGNPNSSSLIQRLVYWRTSLQIIMQHPIFGVGTGDVPEAFRLQYEKTNSVLEPQYRLRSHNQFLSITVAFGILGLFWFIFSLVYPMVRTRGYRNYLYIVFWIIFVLSILTEDTIESQEGVSFYAYFTSLFLFAWSDEKEKTASNESE